MTAPSDPEDRGRSAADPACYGTNRTDFLALVTTQALGALNENIYRMVVALIAVDVSLSIGGTQYLSLTGVIFVLPFVLLSGHAGQVADRFDRRLTVIVIKILEVAVSGLGLLAVMVGRIELLLGTLALFALLAAFFSPVKYALLPELLPAAGLPRGNGLLELSRYVAVIVGSALGGLMSSEWGDQRLLIGVVLLGISSAAAIAGLAIGPVREKQLVHPLRLNPWQDIVAGFDELARNHLITASAGLTAFEFLATLVLLDTMLVGKVNMKLDDFHIGLLVACLGLGVGFGCIAAGRLCGGVLARQLPALGGLGIGLVLLMLPFAANHYLATLSAYAMLGLFGGLVIVPFNALLQSASAEGCRGRVIATNNLFNMTGVLSASGGLWLLHDIAGLSPTGILAAAGAAAMVVSAIGAYYGNIEHDAAGDAAEEVEQTVC